MDKFYIFHDGNTISGIGHTPAEAEADGTIEWKADSGTVQECTAALYAQVEAEGGCISWYEIDDGIACTKSEYNA